jgi:hypothetical protein
LKSELPLRRVEVGRADCLPQQALIGNEATLAVFRDSSLCYPLVLPNELKQRRSTGLKIACVAVLTLIKCSCYGVVEVQGAVPSYRRGEIKIKLQLFLSRRALSDARL